ncbi:DAK2 domain-containing protein [Salinithrix halophila]|uniref:DAK2 domain-containing protein n=1 Tax=Salinithrix halophila TaxID=1485204 RepID=A0ABV8JC04_9BACL
MLVKQIDAKLFTNMIRAGAERLDSHVDKVNALNVFPVPDGDTGTNMNLTLTSGAKELDRKSASSSHVGQLAEALSKGLLMGARGNSGVILSQLFRGFGKGVADKETLNARTFAEGLKQGVATAYKAVIKPVEGTVLTVAREAAEKGVAKARKTDDAVAVMETVLEEARLSLEKTPNLLPVLAQAGVVDAGGQGLVTIYEGFLAALTGEEVSYSVAEKAVSSPAMETIAEIAHQRSAQSHFNTDQIEHGYCTEFIVRLDAEKSRLAGFDEEQFRSDMGRFGDSLLVVADDDLVKVHIHAEHPGETLSYAQRFGDLTRIKIENMREQHSGILEREGHTAVATPDEKPEKKPFGFVAVAAGDGIADIYRSLGVDVVIQGGQTMNPSTEEIVRAIDGVHAEHIFILPNNKNIILTAEQVVELVEMPVTVLPTRTIPQGLAALLAFNPEEEVGENQGRMLESVDAVQSGEVTYAVRDSQYEGGKIEEGDFLGIKEGKILTVGGSLLATSRDLLSKMLAEGADVVTILYGKDVTDAQVKELTDYLSRNYPEVEYDVHYGGQPLYFFLFAVE